MPKRCIGIDLGPTHLRAVQLSQAEGQLRLEKVFSMKMRRNTDSPPDILKTLTKQQGFDIHADVAISMPNDAVFFRNLETDSDQAINSSTLARNFPIPPEQIIVQEHSRRQLPDNKYSLLIAAARKAALHKRLNLITSAGMHPKLAEITIFALHATIAHNHPDLKDSLAIIAYINESHMALAITQAGSILIARNIPIAANSDNNLDHLITDLLPTETETTWRKLFSTQIETDTKMYLAVGEKTSSDLVITLEEKLNCQVITVDPYINIDCPADNNSDINISIAEGLALGVLAPEKTSGINFIDADTANTKPALNLKKELIICAALVTAIAVVSLSSLFIRLSLLEKKYAAIKTEITQTFQQSFPQEKNIVNPTVQLDQKLQALRKDYRLFASFSQAGSSPLEVLRRITEKTPQQKNARINNLFITADSVRLTGSCDSFESVYQWQKLLQAVPEFSNIDVQNPQRDPETGEIYFTMQISSADPLLKLEQK
jgi:Tfp pilus assembly PilM family ATPase